MLKKISLFLLILLLGILAGSFLAFYHAKGKLGTGQRFVKNGEWVASLDIGSKEETLLLRARIALVGLFGLQKSEVIYFNAATDNEGKIILSENDYEISGKLLPARYWSITAYGEDFYLIPNEIDRYAINMETVESNRNGDFRILLSGQKKDKNWLPSGRKKQKIELTLRLYQPAKTAYENLDKIPLPVIRKLN